MAVINNLQQFHAAIAAVCPIDGVSADGAIFFASTATAPQKAAAQAAAAAYTDVPPQVMTIDLALGRMTDAEYAALFTLAQSRPAVHRLLQYIKQMDLTQTNIQNLIQGLVTANVLTSARAAVVFVAPPVLPAPPSAPLPTPTPIAS
jgi:hypothetical protein